MPKGVTEDGGPIKYYKQGDTIWKTDGTTWWFYIGTGHYSSFLAQGWVAWPIHPSLHNSIKEITEDEVFALLL